MEYRRLYVPNDREINVDVRVEVWVEVDVRTGKGRGEVRRFYTVITNPPFNFSPQKIINSILEKYFLEYSILLLDIY